MALISLVDQRRQWFKSQFGFNGRETTRDISFCSHAILGDTVLEVTDTLQDERFFDNPAVTGNPHVRFYAGAPLLTAEGHAMGTLCALDRVPRKLTQDQINSLQALARQVMRQMDLRLLITREKADRQEIFQLNADLERRVHERTADLERTTADLQALSYSLAHDLRQPLISMSGYSHLLQQQARGDKERHYVERISSGIRQINVRADALLYFANLSRRPMQRKNIDLGEMARRCIDALRASDPDRQILVSVQPELMAYADPDLLAQVMQELLDNAWRSSACQQVTWLDVGSALKADGETSYFVKDNGEGFDMLYQDDLFEPFQRLESIHDYDGDGLGLARVKRIVVKHGGRIWAQSTVGNGAAIFFTLAADVMLALQNRCKPVALQAK
ncbi:MAG: ATP-binding protein [Polaromonas sp.]|nr:ATP-binding protein [Polaromonas sp.]